MEKLYDIIGNYLDALDSMHLLPEKEGRMLATGVFILLPIITSCGCIITGINSISK